MAPRSIALADDEDRVVAGLVSSGRFRGAEAVLREGLGPVAEEAGGDFGYTLDEPTAAVQAGSDATTARSDFARIAEGFERHFGPVQARRYGALLVDALVDLQSGPRVLGSAARHDVGPGSPTLRTRVAAVAAVTFRSVA